MKRKVKETPKPEPEIQSESKENVEGTEETQEELSATPEETQREIARLRSQIRIKSARLTIMTLEMKRKFEATMEREMIRNWVENKERN